MHSTTTTSELSRASGILIREFSLSVVEAPAPARIFQAHLDILSSDRGVTIGDLRLGLDVRVRFRDPRAYLVDVPLSGRDVSRQATVSRPLGEAPQRWLPDRRLIVVKIERSVLEGELAQMLDAPVGTPLSLERFDAARGPGAQWLSLVRLIMAGAALDDGLTRHPAVRRRLYQSVVAGLLLTAGHRYRDRLDEPGGRVVAPRAVRRVADAIGAEPGRLFTLDDLSGIAGVSRRSLQESFRRHVGLSPMSYLRDVRLRQAHDQLRAKDRTAVSVSEIANRCGFPHLGRFAAAYRDRFGVSPSQTLRN